MLVHTHAITVCTAEFFFFLFLEVLQSIRSNAEEGQKKKRGKCCTSSAKRGKLGTEKQMKEPAKKKKNKDNKP